MLLVKLMEKRTVFKNLPWLDQLPVRTFGREPPIGIQYVPTIYCPLVQRTSISASSLVINE